MQHAAPRIRKISCAQEFLGLFGLRGTLEFLLGVLIGPDFHCFALLRERLEQTK